MAEKTKKGFRPGIYAIITGVVLAVVLAALATYAYVTRYTAFSAEKVAVQYVDTIVQSGDGYNAYKLTLVSKNQKFGDFVINAYMRPFVNDGDDVKQAEFVGTGSDEETKAIDEVYNEMYGYLLSLIRNNGFDDYDTIFTSYFSKLREVRKAVYGDDYMDTEYMFGAFEANVETYGESLKGTETVFAADNKTVLREYSEGAYQTKYGDMTEVEAEELVDGKKQTVKVERMVYKFTCVVKSSRVFDKEETERYIKEYSERIKPVAESGEAKADAAGLKDEDDKHKYKTAMAEAFKKLDCSEDIKEVAEVIIDVKDQHDRVVTTQRVYVVKIGSSWYIDNSGIGTAGLYLAE